MPSRSITSDGLTCPKFKVMELLRKYIGVNTHDLSLFLNKLKQSMGCKINYTYMSWNGSILLTINFCGKKRIILMKTRYRPTIRGEEEINKKIYYFT